jgi:hypothetical protein
LQYPCNKTDAPVAPPIRTGHWQTYYSTPVIKPKLQNPLFFERLPSHRRSAPGTRCQTYCSTPAIKPTLQSHRRSAPGTRCQQIYTRSEGIKPTLQNPLFFERLTLTHFLRLLQKTDAHGRALKQERLAEITGSSAPSSGTTPALGTS